VLKSNWFRKQFSNALVTSPALDQVRGLLFLAGCVVLRNYRNVLSPILIPAPPFIDANHLRLLIQSWLFLLLGMLSAAALGYGISHLMPNEYRAQVRLLPEFSAKSAMGLQQFGALAEIAGIDLADAAEPEAVRPDLYPDVLESRPFLLSILQQPVETVTGEKFPSLFLLLTKPAGLAALLPFSSRMPLPILPVADDKLLALTTEQDDLLTDLRKRIRADIDKQSGVVVIQVEMPDARVSARVAQIGIAYLRQYVTTYRTEKAKQDVAYLAKRQRESQGRYERALQAWSAYQDANRYMATQVARMETKKLADNLTLAEQLNAQLILDYERAQLRMQEAKPVLNVLEPPVVLPRRSSPRRLLITVAFGLTGLVLGVGWLVLTMKNNEPKSI
jgi:hypothetical protein